jgi:hypothetical protein
MSDDLTPPFEEPVGSSPDDQDELVDGAAEEVDLDGPHEDGIDFFDLSQWVDEGDLLLGFTGMLKILREDGTFGAFHVGVGVNHFEAIGLHSKALALIEEEAEMETNWGDD